MNDPVLFAYKFDGCGGGNEIKQSEMTDSIRDDQVTWVHLDANHDETHKWLTKEVSYLDPYVIEALLADETRPRMTQINDGFILILRGVNLNENSNPEDMVSIRLWIDKNRIISVRKRRLRAVQDLEKKLQNGRGPKSSGQFVAMLLSQLFFRMEPVLSSLDEKTDIIEEQILETGDLTLRESIIVVRKQAIMFRRYMAPQRDAIQMLLMSDIDWMTENEQRHLQENYNHILRYVEDLDAVRERAQIIKDELAFMISDKLNKNMYLLSIIAAIFLPLGFLTGLLGINVGGIPGAENKDAFLVFCFILCVIVSVQIWFFKKFKWF